MNTKATQNKCMITVHDLSAFVVSDKTIELWLNVPQIYWNQALHCLIKALNF